MGYQAYGISKELVNRVKQQLNDPARLEQVKLILKNVTKADLQKKSKISALIQSISKATGISLSNTEKEAITAFLLDQKIDPRNTLHLLKLWGMFR